MPPVVEIALLVLSCGSSLVAVVCVALLLRKGGRGGGAAEAMATQQHLAVLQQLSATQRSVDAQMSTSRDSLDRRFAELAQHLNHRLADVNTQLQTQLAENRKQVGESSKAMLERLENSGKLFANVAQQFGQLQESSKRLTDLGADITKLQQILSPSLRRGKFGELLLEELLRNMLPSGQYACQHSFKEGVIVDAVVKLARGTVCIDSKFPLDSFQRFLDTDVVATGSDGRKQAHKEFVRDCRKHVDAIASKYIRPDEGTLDFALMYIPAENVYYETIVARSELDQAEPIAGYAMGKRVIPVSPNTLAAYLQVIMVGLKGLQIEENAKQILAGLSRVEGEIGKFAEEFRLVGKHLENAGKKFADADRQLGKVNTKFEQLAQLGGAPSPTAGPGAVAGENEPLLRLTAGQ